MKIIIDDKIKTSIGNFNTIFDAKQKTLFVSDDLGNFSKKHNIQKFSQLLSYIEQFPGMIALEFNWSLADVSTAYKNLIQQFNYLVWNIEYYLKNPKKVYNVVSKKGK